MSIADYLYQITVDRRTGIPLNINPRKDSKGFENVDDYFPDSGLFHTYGFISHIALEEKEIFFTLCLITFDLGQILRFNIHTILV